MFQHFMVFRILIIYLKYVSEEPLLHRIHTCMYVCIIDFVTCFNISFITLFRGGRYFRSNECDMPVVKRG